MAYSIMAKVDSDVSSRIVQTKFRCLSLLNIRNFPDSGIHFA